LVKKLNAGDYEGAASEFKNWNRAGGKQLEGLSRRRAAEAALFKGDTMELGKILERQKFGGAQPKKKSDVAETGDSFLDAVGGIDLAKAVSAPIGAAVTPSDKLTPDNTRMELLSDPPQFKDIGEQKSEALTPLPDSPEAVGAKAAEKVAKDIMPESPEDVGAKAAEKMAKDLAPTTEGEATAPKTKEEKKDSLAFGLMEMAKGFAKPSEKPEEPKKGFAMGGISFNSPTLGTFVSGLKRRTGLGAK
jgi:hypothetical protein